MSLDVHVNVRVKTFQSQFAINYTILFYIHIHGDIHHRLQYFSKKTVTDAVTAIP